MCTMILRLSIIALVGCAYIQEISGNQLESWNVKRTTSKYCGPGLVQVFQLVCGGRYNTLLEKKSGVGSIPVELMDPDPDFEDGPWLQNAELNALSFPFRARSMASALAPRTFRRVLRGAHDECCKKSCSFQEIQSYCAESD